MQQKENVMSKTLQGYFERGEKAGIIDYNLRVVRSPRGDLDFYLHPTGKDGETGDFTVTADRVFALLGVAAGSDR